MGSFLQVVHAATKKVEKAETISIEIETENKGIRVYPGQADREVAQQLIFSKIEEITIYRQKFNDWEFKVIQRADAYDGFMWWKTLALSFRLDGDTNTAEIITLHE